LYHFGSVGKAGLLHISEHGGHTLAGHAGPHAHRYKAACYQPDTNKAEQNAQLTQMAVPLVEYWIIHTAAKKSVSTRRH
jgi:hypothetical protein